MVFAVSDMQGTRDPSIGQAGLCSNGCMLFISYSFCPFVGSEL